MDLTIIVGLCIGIGGIFFGNLLEGGHFSSLIQLTAGIIVVGGTLGATVISHRYENLCLGWRLLKFGFKKEDPGKWERAVLQILNASDLARKESVIAIEAELSSYSDIYMRELFKRVVEGVGAKNIQTLAEIELELEERRLFEGAKVWGDAGGFAPTIGILGAVLGLIHVMANLSDTSKLGVGIAVAFVATIYGVGAANLILLPIANKLKNKIRNLMEFRKMILIGAIGIVEGDSKRMLRGKLQPFIKRNYHLER